MASAYTPDIFMPMASVPTVLPTEKEKTTTVKEESLSDILKDVNVPKVIGGALSAITIIGLLAFIAFRK